jgi:xylan 1,4-beta-xylosidase
MRTILRVTIIASLLVGGMLFAGDEAQSPHSTSSGAFPVTISVDAAQSKGELRPIWQFFGCDEPNYAYMKDGKKLLAELGQLGPHPEILPSPGTDRRLVGRRAGGEGGNAPPLTLTLSGHQPKVGREKGLKENIYFRTHNLLTTGDGTPALKWGSTNAYTEDQQGRAVYDWNIVDRIFDTYLERGLKPYVEIGFMPKALSIKPEPYQHRWTPTAKYDEIYTGWSYPPKDYAKWAELVYQWAKHCGEKYGQAEVERWYWEVWNEANIGYWRGSREDFFKLHDFALDAVRRAVPKARVGGPDMAGSDPKYMRAFFEHCLRGTNYATGKIGTPLDFVSFHAKGQPKFVGGHQQMGIAAQLSGIDRGFAVIASFPELKGKPIVIGESDPDGCAACQGPQLGYRNGTMYSSYTAASFARKYDLAERHGVNLEGALTWAFEFEDQPYFAGFRVLATGSIDLPVLNVFRMFSLMGGKRVAVQSSGGVALDNIIKNGVRGAPDVSAMASLEAKKLSVMAWHYHDDDLPGPDAVVELLVSALPAGISSARLQHYRIDQNHSNAFTEWKKMGSPQTPTPEQYAELEMAGRLTQIDAPATTTIDGGKAVLRFTLPRQAVSLVVLEWE